MKKGYKCPLCGSMCAEDIGYSAGGICGSQAMTGPNPDKCSPEHPCPGILVPLLDEEQDTE